MSLVIAACSGCGLSDEKSILMAAGAYGDLAVVVVDGAAIKQVVTTEIGRAHV